SRLPLGIPDMIQRMTVALATFLFCATATYAQPGDPAPAGSAPGPLAEFMAPGRWEMPASEGRFWVSADYLIAWVRAVNLPPLVTTSDAGTAKINAGVLGQQGVSTLFGDQWVNGDMRSGLRFGAGWWFGPERILGMEAGFTVL